MNHRLIVFVTEHWPQPSSADWVALDARDNVCASGRSEPQHWPAAEHCVAVLGGAQCVWLEVVLPPAARRERGRLLAYALEERLLRDPDSQHLVVTHTRAEEDGEGRNTGVLAVSRARLRQLVAAFETLGRPLEQVWSALLSAPAAADGWSLSFTPDAAAVLRCGEHAAYVVECGEDNADGIEPAVADLLEHGEVPARLTLYAAPEQARTLASSLQARWPLTIDALPANAWWQPPRPSANLLSGEFAPQGRRHGWRGVRGPLVLAGVAAAMWTTVAVADLVVLRVDHAALLERMVRVFADSVPDTSPVVPPVQLRRAVDVAREAQGELLAGDLLGLLATHVEAGGTLPTGFDYAGGTLRLELATEPAAALPGRLFAAGVKARAEGRKMVLEAVR